MVQVRITETDKEKQAVQEHSSSAETWNATFSHLCIFEKSLLAYCYSIII